ncbi:FAD-dependent oxidoreductase [Tenacibaculum aiptasiae]|uniref:Tryptophan 2-monooxygenase n=1 Tax=Tenacibaculum aiptasiae TaxID=426481 RepID=A0A7J5AP56_9FLAO|nr:NAD(P)/FAD-dependent oxidoreductase [Tenacibaculum aiptasiae]KAB1159398.1 FAD-dependent oxidoreductase [Tenacibaculum aiptasiae]
MSKLLNSTLSTFLSIFFLTSTMVSCNRKTDIINQNDFEGEVIIIGAGAAGLAAAKMLDSKGINYKILEATNYYGGRVQKNNDFADFPIDEGAEWIHADKSILNTLIGKEGKEPSIETILYQPMNVYSFDGKNYKKVPKTSLEYAYSLFTEYKFKNTTWYDYLDNHFAKNVKHNIIYNTKITTIDYTGNKVKIVTEKGKEYQADKVILTVSVGVLKSKAINFIPALTSNKIKAIESVDFLPGFKLFLKFSEKFYPDMIACETSNGEKTFYDVAYHKNSQDNVLGLLSTGISAEKYYQLGSQEKIIKEVLKELDEIYDGKASKHYLGKYLIKNWGKQIYTLGTWTSNETDTSSLKELNKPLQNKVFFAGETYDLNEERSTVQGAILSGYNTVKLILEKN